MKKNKLILILFIMLAFLSNIQAAIINGGQTDKTSTGGYYPYDDEEAIWGLAFNAASDFTLISVKVYNQASDYSGVRTFAVKDASGNIVATKDVTVADGEQRISLDFSIPTGNGYLLLAMDHHKGLWRDSQGASLSFPYDIGGVVSITGDTRYDGGASVNTANYHFFYDWEINTAAPLRSSFNYSYTGRDVSLQIQV